MIKEHECKYPGTVLFYKTTPIVHHLAKNSIICKDTPIGYAQLLHFALFGDNFGLRGQACADWKCVVTSVEQVEKFVQKWECGLYYMASDFRERMKMIEALITPRIEFIGDYCIIEWVEVESEYGIFRREYRISRKCYMIERMSEQTIVSVKSDTN